MPIDHILSLLLAERQKLDAAIAALGGPGGGTPAKKLGRPPKNQLANAPDWVLPKAKPARKARKFSAQQRAEQSARAKAMWRKRKAAAKKGAKGAMG
jgi:hypothetical protein